MLVTLMRHTPDPELTIAAAALISASPSLVTKHLEKLTPERVDHLLAPFISARHLSPREHASFTVSIEHMSRVTSHQLLRHRLARYAFVNVIVFKKWLPNSLGDNAPTPRGNYENLGVNIAKSG